MGTLSIAQEKFYQKFCMKKTYQTGIYGEQLASRWLENHEKMRLLENRFRTKAGEIDLIMTDGETIVFIEVKTRLNTAPGTGLLAVDKKKQQRIARAAYLFLSQKRWLHRSVRFDIVEVSADKILHIKNAFQPGSMFFG